MIDYRIADWESLRVIYPYEFFGLTKCTAFGYVDEELFIFAKYYEPEDCPPGCFSQEFLEDTAIAFRRRAEL
jgi:hypothetical protein